MANQHFLLLFAIFFLSAYLGISGTCGVDPYCLSVCDYSEDGPGNCDQCQIGFFLDPDNYFCYPCALQNCGACDGRDNCTECTQNYTLVGNSCVQNPIIINCISFTSSEGNVVCDSCDNGFYVASDLTSCVKCPAGSLTCTSGIQCTSCDEGFYLKTVNEKTLCYPCLAGCQVCPSSVKCDKCHAGYFLNTYLGCEECIANCTACTSNTSCTTCVQGYYSSTVNQAVTCKPCQANCLECSDSTSCTKCRLGYEAISGSCSACSVSECSEYQTQNSCVCASCSSGTPQASGSVCITCPTGCEACSDSTSCQNCAIGYYMNGNACMKCSVGMSNCLECSDASICTRCSAQYLLNTDYIPNECIKCSQTIADCQKCISSSVCTKCYPGTVLKSTKEACIKCETIANCDQCTNQLICQKCNTGYFMVKSAESADYCSECSNLDADCLECTTEGKCTKIKDDKKYESEGTFYDCTNINNLCLTCSIQGECLSCSIAGYFASGTACLPCISIYENCGECSSRECISCLTGFFVESGECQDCSLAGSHCNDCIDFQTCKGCLEGYYLDTINKICRKCSSGCVSCEMAGTSQQCFGCEELYLYDSILKACTPCSPGCATGCIGTLSTCKDAKCVLGYKQATDSTCVEDTNCIQPHCLDCSKTLLENYCTTCEDGFLSLYGSCLLNGQNSVTVDFDAYYETTKYEISALLTQAMEKLGSGKFYEYLQQNDPINQNVLENRHSTLFFYIAYLMAIDLGYDMDYLITKVEENEDEFLEIMDDYDTLTSPSKILFIGDKIFPSVALTEAELLNNFIKQVFILLPSTSCQKGYSLVSSKCLLCTASNCDQCEDQSTVSCATCLPKYYVDDGVCKACDPSCKSCSGTATDCTSCYTGSVLEGSACTKCEGACDTCDSAQPALCLTCIWPFSQSADEKGKCYECQQLACLNCLSTNTSFCTDCIDGKALLNGVCLQCTENCLKCYTPGQSDCYECQSGFLLSEGRCLQCPSYCSVCSSSNVCTTCLQGYYKDESRKCRPCMDGCQACVVDSSCTIYQEGVVLFINENGSKHLVECRHGCSKCDPNNPSVCLKCFSGFYLAEEEAKCKPCVENCESCSNGDTCDFCLARSHRVLVDSNYVCQKCKGNCATCQENNLEKCLTCRRGYTLSGAVCLRFCAKGCSICSDYNSAICETCSEGYTLTESGTCAKCIGTCNGECDPKDINACLSCAHGYYLKGGVCEKCLVGCGQCENGVCTNCIDGYQFKSGSCSEICQSPCKSCSQGKCTECISHFILQGGTCYPDLSCNPSCEYCPPGTYEEASGNCAACSVKNCASCSVFECFSCFGGFYLQKDSSGKKYCQECDPTCKICSGPQHCEACAPGYLGKVIILESKTEIEFSGECEACSSQCATCFIQPEYCLSCFDDRKLNGTTCIGRRVVSLSYILNTDYGAFMENSQIEKVVSLVCQVLGIDVSRIYVKEVKKGSVAVSLLITSNSEGQATAMKKAAQTITFDYSITSSAFTIYYDDKQVAETTEDQTKTDPTINQEGQVNVGLIVGAALGSVIIVIVIAFIVYQVKKGSPKSEPVDDISKQSNEVQDSTDHIKLSYAQTKRKIRSRKGKEKDQS